MTKTNKPKFKVGDRVYTIKNSAWGMVPMRIEKLYDGIESCSCQHPTMGVGGFDNADLALEGVSRSKALEPLAELKARVQKLEAKLFGTK